MITKLSTVNYDDDDGNKCVSILVQVDNQPTGFEFVMHYPFTLQDLASAIGIQLHWLSKREKENV